MTSDTKERRIRGTVPVALLALATALAGCADLTSGGFGEAEAYMAGDAPPRSPGSAAAEGAPPPLAASRAGDSPRPAAAEAALDATVTVGVRVFLRTAFGEWSELTLGTQTLELSAEGTEERLITRRVVAADIYSGVRIVFTRIEADVRSGLVVDGLPVVGQVRVNASAQDPVEIEAAVDLVVEDDGVAAVLIDLNAPSWLRTASLVGRLVGRPAFRAAVEVHGR